MPTPGSWSFRTASASTGDTCRLIQANCADRSRRRERLSTSWGPRWSASARVRRERGSSSWDRSAKTDSTGALAARTAPLRSVMLPRLPVAAIFKRYCSRARRVSRDPCVICSWVARPSNAASAAMSNPPIAQHAEANPAQIAGSHAGRAASLGAAAGEKVQQAWAKSASLRDRSADRRRPGPLRLRSSTSPGAGRRHAGSLAGQPPEPQPARRSVLTSTVSFSFSRSRASSSACRRPRA